jgi:hypothetical protein
MTKHSLLSRCPSYNNLSPICNLDYFAKCIITDEVCGSDNVYDLYLDGVWSNLGQGHWSVKNSTITFDEELTL